MRSAIRKCWTGMRSCEKPDLCGISFNVTRNDARTTNLVESWRNWRPQKVQLWKNCVELLRFDLHVRHFIMEKFGLAPRHSIFCWADHLRNHRSIRFARSAGAGRRFSFDHDGRGARTIELIYRYTHSKRCRARDYSLLLKMTGRGLHRMSGSVSILCRATILGRVAAVGTDQKKYPR